jgi:hypothetical protein
MNRVKVGVVGVRRVLTVAWQLQDAVFRHPRFADTSLEIHRQWQRRQLHTFPSVVAADVTVRRITRGTVGLLQPRVRVTHVRLREDHKNRMLRRVCGPKRDGVTGGWRKLRDEELHNLYSLLSNLLLG